MKQQDTYEQKKQVLTAFMKKEAEENILIAFSGGVDSGLLLKTACEAAQAHHTTVYAVTVHTVLQPACELEEAKQQAQAAGAVWMAIGLDELEEAGIENNPIDRCYRCKKCIFTQLRRQAETLQIKTILDGTNADDLSKYRPGIKALKELDIISPLADACMTKEEVRRMAKEYQLTAANKPASPCMATRFPYGTALSYKDMRRAEQGERFLRQFGFYNVRLRIHGTVARIEVDDRSFTTLMAHKQEINTYLKRLGYCYITLDLEGFRSGSMDEIIKEEITSKARQ